MKSPKLVLSFCLWLILQTIAWGDVALQFGNFSLRTDQETTFGWSFTLSSPLFVTDLGYFDFQNDGLTDAHPVAIWTSAGGAPILTATVPAGASSSLIDGVRYVAITPTFLPAGTYIIGGYSPNFSDSVAIENASINAAPGIAYNGSRSAQGAGLMFPSGNTQGYANGDFGPNFQFAPVPEPSAVALLLLGGAGTLAVWKRRNSRGAA